MSGHEKREEEKQATTYMCEHCEPVYLRRYCFSRVNSEYYPRWQQKQNIFVKHVVEAQPDKMYGQAHFHFTLHSIRCRLRLIAGYIVRYLDLHLNMEYLFLLTLITQYTDTDTAAHLIELNMLLRGSMQTLLTATAKNQRCEVNLLFGGRQNSQTTKWTTKGEKKEEKKKTTQKGSKSTIN